MMSVMSSQGGKSLVMKSRTSCSRWLLLYRVRQFVREEPASLGAGGLILAGTEEDVVADGEGPGADGERRASRLRTDVGANRREVVAEARLKLRTQHRWERRTPGAHCLDTRLDARWHDGGLRPIGRPFLRDLLALVLILLRRWLILADRTLRCAQECTCDAWLTR